MLKMENNLYVKMISEKTSLLSYGLVNMCINRKEVIETFLCNDPIQCHVKYYCVSGV